jgi:hypothetical protein
MYALHLCAFVSLSALHNKTNMLLVFPMLLSDFFVYKPEGGIRQVIRNNSYESSLLGITTNIRIKETTRVAERSFEITP